VRKGAGRVIEYSLVWESKLERGRWTEIESGKRETMRLRASWREKGGQR
jgi:hypothetical protein